MAFKILFALRLCLSVSHARSSPQQFAGVCVFDVDRTLTCGSNLLEQGCLNGSNCYSEQGKPAYLYQDEQEDLENTSEIFRLVALQEAMCVVSELPTCYDRAYVWSKNWTTSPKVDYSLRLSKDIHEVVKRCESNNFAIAIATHGGLDFVDVQDSCPTWDPQCSQPSTCKISKRCQAVHALELQKMDANLESNCDNESVFVQHNEDEDKDLMMIAILRNLHAQKKIDTSGKPFKIWFFDDEGRNRKIVADSHAKYTSVLAAQVQTCAFSPSEWTSYQNITEGGRGNNLATGCDIRHIAKQISDQPPWATLTNTGCKSPESGDIAISSGAIHVTVALMRVILCSIVASASASWQ